MSVNTELIPTLLSSPQSGHVTSGILYSTSNHMAMQMEGVCPIKTIHKTEKSHHSTLSDRNPSLCGIPKPTDVSAPWDSFSEGPYHTLLLGVIESEPQM